MRLVALSLLALSACYESHAVEILPDGRVVEVDAGSRTDLGVIIDAPHDASTDAGALMCGATEVDLRGATACRTISIAAFPHTCSYHGVARDSTYVFIVPPASESVFLEVNWLGAHDGRAGTVSDCATCDDIGGASDPPGSTGPGGFGEGPFDLPPEGALVMISVEPPDAVTAMICPGELPHP